MSLPPFLLNPQTSKLFSLHPTSTFTLLPPSHRLFPSQTLAFSRKASSLSRSSRPSRVQFSPQHRQEEFDHDDDELVVGDCVVYEEGIFEDPYLEEEKFDAVSVFPRKNSKSKVEVKGESLIPDKWKEAEAEINLTKKEKRKMRQEMEYGSRVEKRRQGLAPIRDVSVADYVAFRGKSLLELSPIIEEEPNFTDDDDGESRQGDSGSSTSSRRVAPRNPRWAVYGGTLDDISEIFSSGNYDSEAAQNPDGHRKLFTKEEKVLLNRRVPDLSAATSGKWQPLHTLAASGEFDLVNALLNHSVDINIQDKDGLTALHKAIISKKLPVFTDLLRESANPFVCDKEGATLMHYAVRTASSQMIKILLLHHVDINLQDNDGWTPLHLAVQTRRTDIVRLLLIKGAHITLKNQDGLTPLDLCLYSGHDTTTYELIKLMKQAASQPAVAALS